MLKTRDGRPIPNNPAQAFNFGVKLGTQDNMNLVAMVLCDKFGFHIREKTTGRYESCRDNKSIERLYNEIVSLRNEVLKPGSNVKMIDIRKVLEDEYKTIFDG